MIKDVQERAYRASSHNEDRLNELLVGVQTSTDAEKIKAETAEALATGFPTPLHSHDNGHVIHAQKVDTDVQCPSVGTPCYPTSRHVTDILGYDREGEESSVHLSRHSLAGSSLAAASANLPSVSEPIIEVKREVLEPEYISTIDYLRRTSRTKGRSSIVKSGFKDIAEFLTSNNFKSEPVGTLSVTNASIYQLKNGMDEMEVIKISEYPNKEYKLVYKDDKNDMQQVIRSV